MRFWVTALGFVTLFTIASLSAFFASVREGASALRISQAETVENVAAFAERRRQTMARQAPAPRAPTSLADRPKPEMTEDTVVYTGQGNIDFRPLIVDAGAGPGVFVDRFLIRLKKLSIMLPTERAQIVRHLENQVNILEQRETLNEAIAQWARRELHAASILNQ